MNKRFGLLTYVSMTILVVSLILSLNYSYNLVNERNHMIQQMKSYYVLDIEDVSYRLTKILKSDAFVNGKIDRGRLTSIYRDLESIHVHSRHLKTLSIIPRDQRLVIDSIRITSRNLSSFLEQASIETTPFELNTCTQITIHSEKEIKDELNRYLEVFNTAKGNGKFNGSNDFEKWYQYIIAHWDTENFSNCHLRVVKAQQE